jgi:hypothetical protein
MTTKRTSNPTGPKPRAAAEAKISMQIYMPPDVRNAVAERAAEEGRSMTDLVVDATRQYLARKK